MSARARLKTWRGSGNFSLVVFRGLVPGSSRFPIRGAIDETIPTRGVYPEECMLLTLAFPSQPPWESRVREDSALNPFPF
jgi:hypothetical protein